jgi:hypothetical protein
LKEGAGVTFDFGNSKQLATEINKLLKSDTLRKEIRSIGLHSMAPTAWENAAIAHALLFQELSDKKLLLNYKTPE